MRISRRELQTRTERQARRIDTLTTSLAEAEANASASASQLGRIAAELSTCKDVIASHIAAAGHPSTVLHDVRSFADALQQALADAGVDLRVELARLEGSHL